MFRAPHEILEMCANEEMFIVKIGIKVGEVAQLTLPLHNIFSEPFHLSMFSFLCTLMLKKKLMCV